MSLHAALQKRYDYPEFALLWEVRNAAGFRATRSADAVAIGLWPSRGLHVHGFEIKRDRSDWLREKNDPAKAEQGMKHCDFIWLVTDEGVVKDKEEIPALWGWQEMKGKRLITRIDAKAKDSGLETGARHFLAAMMKRAFDAVRSCAATPEVLEARIKQAVEAERKRKSGHEATELKMAKREVEVLKETITRFEVCSGVKINLYQERNIGQAVQAVLSDAPSLWRLADMENVLESMLKSVRSLGKQFPQRVEPHVHEQTMWTRERLLDEVGKHVDALPVELAERVRTYVDERRK